MKPQERSNLNTIEIPLHDANGEPTDDPEKAATWQRITDPIIIEDKLLERNKKHFGQAEGSLFSNPNFQEMFQYEGVSPGVDMLLEGKLEVDAMPDLDKGSRTLLTFLGNGRQLTKIDTSISWDAFIQALRKWPENTSTLASGRHLGHYKCLMVDDGHSKLYNDENPDPAKLILSIYYKSQQ
jgi:hypothetical protein